MDFDKLIKEMGGVAKREVILDGLRICVAQLLRAGVSEADLRKHVEYSIAKARDEQRQPPVSP